MVSGGAGTASWSQRTLLDRCSRDRGVLAGVPACPSTFALCFGTLRGTALSPSCRPTRCLSSSARAVPAWPCAGSATLANRVLASTRVAKPGWPGCAQAFTLIATRSKGLWPRQSCYTCLASRLRSCSAPSWSGSPRPSSSPTSCACSLTVAGGCFPGEANRRGGTVVVVLSWRKNYSYFIVRCCPQRGLPILDIRTS